ncbi:MAG: hypothetical protein QOJ64_2738 [Acidobacteriota bacterium]|jgi:hypothetical protein|nr:hypothetical protein [Acidobacteriota bacterium]
MKATNHQSNDGQIAPEQAATPLKTISEPSQILLAYSQKRANANDVMRSLISHRDWVAPLAQFARGREQARRVEGILMLSTETRITPGELWIFTDREATLRAQSTGALLGSYAGSMAGTELFGNIPSDTKAVRINPGSSVEYTWTLREGGGIEAGKIWADAVALEDSFEHWRQSGKPDKTVFTNYLAFLTFDHVSGPVITLPGHSGMSNPAAAFTAPDCADLFLSELTEEQRGEMRRVTIGGNRLLEQATMLGIDGLIINVFGPGATYALPFSVIN